MSLKQKIQAWLSLIRVPNLFTVPGDVILGYLTGETFLQGNDYLLGYVISKGEFANFAILYTCISVLFVYIFGLVTNDIADIKEDTKERPYRPIPSGKISVHAAVIFATLLVVSALVLAIFSNLRVFLVILILLILVTSYNFVLKKNQHLGPLSVAICRLFSVTAGYYASGLEMKGFPPMFYIICFVWLIYFLRLSLIAYNETEQNSPFKKNYIFLLIPVVWLITAVYVSGSLDVLLMVGLLPPGIFLGLGAVIVFSIFMFKNFIVLNMYYDKPKKVQSSVGDLIKAVIFLQASGCAFLGYPYVALAVFLIWIPTHLVSKRFYSS